MSYRILLLMSRLVVTLLSTCYYVRVSCLGWSLSVRWMSVVVMSSLVLIVVLIVTSYWVVCMISKMVRALFEICTVVFSAIVVNLGIFINYFFVTGVVLG